MAASRFSNKDDARTAVWDRLQVQRLARFPFPPHGRIPNFAGADRAARRLFELAPWKNAKRLKINPDAPQRPVREESLRRGIQVYVPTPRLRGGFMLLDPAVIPPDKIRAASGLSTGARWAKKIRLKNLPPMDAIVCGSVAVTRRGRRCGRGKGTAISNSPSCGSWDILRCRSPRRSTTCRSLMNSRWTLPIFLSP